MLPIGSVRLDDGHSRWSPEPAQAVEALLLIALGTRMQPVAERHRRAYARELG
jgi:hypothetical protein